MFYPPPPNPDDPTEPSAALIASLPFPLRPPPPGPLPPARYEELGINLKYGEPIPADLVKLPWKSDPTDPDPIRFDLVDRDSLEFRNFLANRPPLRRPPPEYEEVPLPLGEGMFVVWSKFGNTTDDVSGPFIIGPELPPDYVFERPPRHPLLIPPNTKVYSTEYRRRYLKGRPAAISSSGSNQGYPLNGPSLLYLHIPQKKRSILRKASTNATVGVQKEKKKN